MLAWNAQLYSRFEDERTRPAADLLARVALPSDTAYVVDLGCGPGNSTELLAQRFVQARVLGVDQSQDMLAAARQRLAHVHFEQGDIAQWQAPLHNGRLPDLIFANAALQWVPDHHALLPRLMGMLAPGGVLAVQMPDNRDEPSHRLMREVAALQPWAAEIGDPHALRTDLLALNDYYDVLARDAQVDAWRTAYQHPMDSAEAIVQWVSGTGLRPFLQPLPSDLQTSFVAEYTRRIDAAYAPRSDGRRLLAFPRLFLVARRPI
ncbi:trans-aconitate 2-methyltransferase [Comamonas piscis]|uniref:Trans-aconitate 2-methyltransferase n=1 Tax=Comamonas piscis TaxID=1562974 RepID=A0A7G5EGA9_9BURK|nr:trans-aconitate 2-methyltransferase [Comamonas piscis]QMV73034.1 trans-aconitate 2-methyltransferase [Comamonas piscis]WSO35818.1 trans-aconitate 2-methyltransferase [Comamonas piscis]